MQFDSFCFNQSINQSRVRLIEHFRYRCGRVHKWRRYKILVC